MMRGIYGRPREKMLYNLRVLTERVFARSMGVYWAVDNEWSVEEHGNITCTKPTPRI